MRYPLDQERLLVIQIANIASIGLNSVVRYLAYRRWVFPALGGPGAAAPADPADPAAAGDALPTGTRGAA